MKQKVTPAMIVAAVAVCVAVVFGLYWFTIGGGRSGARIDERFTKLPEMKGAMKMPTIPPPPPGMAQPFNPSNEPPVPPGGPPRGGR